MKLSEPQNQAHRPSISSNTCDRHPDEIFTGFCPSCLCERLSILDDSSSLRKPNTTAATTTTNTAATAIKAIFKVSDKASSALRSGSKASSSIAAATTTSFCPELRRTKSFSASRERFSGVFEPQRKSCDVQIRLECLLVDPTEHPMLLAEPSFNIHNQREKTAELMFEKYKVPALFLAKNAVLTSFASGRATSLVVDCGGGSTTVAPVHDGYVLQKAVVSSPIGGELLSDCLMKSLESKGIMIKPRYSFKRKEVRPGEFQTVDVDFPNTTESYKLYSQRIIASDIKECVCRAPDTPYDEISYSNIPMTSYELPDGQTIEIGADRFKIPDILFNPSLVQTIPGMESFAVVAASARGLPQMVIDSINKSDVDIRRELYNSILLAGGTVSMQQLKERLEKDLLEESPQAARVKVLASGNATERRFSVWIGGSILASLGSFQQMWFSKSEYEEHGASYIQRKCP